MTITTRDSDLSGLFFNQSLTMNATFPSSYYPRLLQQHVDN